MELLSLYTCNVFIYVYIGIYRVYSEFFRFILCFIQTVTRTFVEKKFPTSHTIYIFYILYDNSSRVYVSFDACRTDEIGFKLSVSMGKNTKITIIHLVIASYIGLVNAKRRQPAETKSKNLRIVLRIITNRMGTIIIL